LRRLLAAVAAAGVLGSVVLSGSLPAVGGVPAAGVSAVGPLTTESFEGYDWWYEALRIDAAHRRGATGDGVTVALVDGAPDLRIGELRGQDVRLRTDCNGNRAQPPSDAELSNGLHGSHGTSMAALIVGSGRGNAAGGSGVAGIAPQARLLAYDASPTGGLCRGDQIGALVDQAVEDGADIISMSMIVDRGVVPAVERALQAGVVVVGGLPSKGADLGASKYPAAVAGAVAVQAVDRDADPWRDTIPSPHAVIAAPGVEIGSGFYVRSTGRFESDGWTTGTSGATAIVAGALAAVKSRHPEATGNQLVQHLIHNGGGEKNFDWDGTYGFGIASVTTMLRSSPTQWPDENPLLEGPEQAVKSYPTWVSSEVEDPPGKGENAPEADPAAGQDDRGSASEQQEPGSTAADEQDEGMPRWLWPVAGLLVVALAGGVLLARRRGGGTAEEPAREQGDR